MNELKEDLIKIVRGEVLDDAESLKTYSHDTGILEVTPKVIAFPKDVEDIKNLVNYVNQHKNQNPSLSITPRSAGSDMGGGPLNNSIIIDVTRHLNKIKELKPHTATMQPGVF